MKNHLDVRVHPTKHYGLKAKFTPGETKIGIKHELSEF